MAGTLQINGIDIVTNQANIVMDGAKAFGLVVSFGPRPEARRLHDVADIRLFAATSAGEDSTTEVVESHPAL